MRVVGLEIDDEIVLVAIALLAFDRRRLVLALGGGEPRLAFGRRHVLHPDARRLSQNEPGITPARKDGTTPASLSG